MNSNYNDDFRKIMKANLDSSNMSVNRVEEIFNFSKCAGFKSIGIAHCIIFTKEAKILEEYFSQSFCVFIVDCKYGRLKEKDILGGNSTKVLCNPAGQSDYLNKHNTDLNISMGLCVGHDMIFSKKSEAYVTNLFDKDFTNNNSPEIAVAEVSQKPG